MRQPFSSLPAPQLHPQITFTGDQGCKFFHSSPDRHLKLHPKPQFSQLRDAIRPRQAPVQRLNCIPKSRFRAIRDANSFTRRLTDTSNCIPNRSFPPLRDAIRPREAPVRRLNCIPNYLFGRSGMQILSLVAWPTPQIASLTGFSHHLGMQSVLDKRPSGASIASQTTFSGDQGCKFFHSSPGRHLKLHP